MAGLLTDLAVVAVEATRGARRVPGIAVELPPSETMIVEPGLAPSAAVVLPGAANQIDTAAAGLFGGSSNGAVTATTPPLTGGMSGSWTDHMGRDIPRAPETGDGGGNPPNDPPKGPGDDPVPPPDPFNPVAARVAIRSRLEARQRDLIQIADTDPTYGVGDPAEIAAAELSYRTDATLGGIHANHPDEFTELEAIVSGEFETEIASQRVSAAQVIRGTTDVPGILQQEWRASTNVRRNAELAPEDRDTLIAGIRSDTDRMLTDLRAPDGGAQWLTKKEVGDIAEAVRGDLREGWASEEASYVEQQIQTAAGGEITVIPATPDSPPSLVNNANIAIAQIIDTYEAGARIAQRIGRIDTELDLGRQRDAALTNYLRDIAPNIEAGSPEAAQLTQRAINDLGAQARAALDRDGLREIATIPHAEIIAVVRLEVEAQLAATRINPILPDGTPNRRFTAATGIRPTFADGSANPAYHSYTTRQEAAAAGVGINDAAWTDIFTNRTTTVSREQFLEMVVRPARETASFVLDHLPSYRQEFIDFRVINNGDPTGEELSGLLNDYGRRMRADPAFANLANGSEDEFWNLEREIRTAYNRDFQARLDAQRALTTNLIGNDDPTLGRSGVLQAEWETTARARRDFGLSGSNRDIAIAGAERARETALTALREPGGASAWLTEDEFNGIRDGQDARLRPRWAANESGFVQGQIDDAVAGTTVALPSVLPARPSLVNTSGAPIATIVDDAALAIRQAERTGRLTDIPVLETDLRDLLHDYIGIVAPNFVTAEEARVTSGAVRTGEHDALADRAETELRPKAEDALDRKGAEELAAAARDAEKIAEDEIEEQIAATRHQPMMDDGAGGTIANPDYHTTRADAQAAGIGRHDAKWNDLLLGETQFASPDQLEEMRDGLPDGVRTKAVAEYDADVLDQTERLTVAARERGVLEELDKRIVQAEERAEIAMRATDGIRARIQEEAVIDRTFGETAVHDPATATRFIQLKLEIARAIDDARRAARATVEKEFTDALVDGKIIIKAGEKPGDPPEVDTVVSDPIIPRASGAEILASARAVEPELSMWGKFKAAAGEVLRPFQAVAQVTYDIALPVKWLANDITKRILAPGIRSAINTEKDISKNGPAITMRAMDLDASSVERLAVQQFENPFVRTVRWVGGEDNWLKIKGRALTLAKAQNGDAPVAGFWAPTGGWLGKKALTVYGISILGGVILNALPWLIPPVVGEGKALDPQLPFPLNHLHFFENHPSWTIGADGALLMWSGLGGRAVPLLGIAAAGSASPEMVDGFLHMGLGKQFAKDDYMLIALKKFANIGKPWEVDIKTGDPLVETNRARQNDQDAVAEVGEGDKPTGRWLVKKPLEKLQLENTVDRYELAGATFIGAYAFSKAPKTTALLVGAGLADARDRDLHNGKSSFDFIWNMAQIEEYVEMDHGQPRLINGRVVVRHPKLGADGKALLEGDHYTDLLTGQSIGADAIKPFGPFMLFGDWGKKVFLPALRSASESAADDASTPPLPQNVVIPYTGPFAEGGKIAYVGQGPNAQMILYYPFSNGTTPVDGRPGFSISDQIVPNTKIKYTSLTLPVHYPAGGEIQQRADDQQGHKKFVIVYQPTDNGYASAPDNACPLVPSTLVKECPLAVLGIP